MEDKIEVKGSGIFLVDMMLEYAPLEIFIIDRYGKLIAFNKMSSWIFSEYQSVKSGKDSVFEIDYFKNANIKERFLKEKDNKWGLELRIEINGKKANFAIYPLSRIGDFDNMYACFIEYIEKDKNIGTRGRGVENIVRLLLESISDAILVLEVESRRIVFANNKASQLLGYSRADFFDMPVKRLHPDDEYERIVSILDRQGRGEIEFAEDIPFIRKDGNIIYVDVNSTRIVASGKVYLVGVLRDITYKKALLSKLLTTNRLLEAIFEKTNLMFAHMNEDFKIVRVNENFARILGPDVEQFVGRNFFDIFDEPELRALFEEVILLKKSLSMREFPFRTPDGRMVFVDFMISSLDEEGSDLKGLIFSGIDVTELVSTKSALMEVEYIKNTVLHELNELVTYITPDFVIKWANKQYLNASLYENFENLVGKKCYTALENETSPCGNCPAIETLNDLKSHSAYVKFPDGREFYVRSFPDIRDGKLEGIVVACLDVTQLRERERSINRLNNMLTVMKKVNRVIMRGEAVDEIAKGVTEVLGKKEDYRFALMVLTDRLNIPVYFYVTPESFATSLQQLSTKMQKGETPPCIEKVFSEDIVIEPRPEERCMDCSLKDVCSEGYGILARRLEYKGHVMGFLIVCVKNENIGDNEEVELFKELADDVAYALFHLKLN